MHPYYQRHSIQGIRTLRGTLFWIMLMKPPFDSNIVLALMSTGEVYLTDLRKEHRSRVELCEVQDDNDEEPNKLRYVIGRPILSDV
jgi:hypothetical protein